MSRTPLHARVCLSERQVMTKVVDSCQRTWAQEGRRVLVSVNIPSDSALSLSLSIGTTQNPLRTIRHHWCLSKSDPANANSKLRELEGLQ